MIESLKFKNYKALRELSLEGLGRLNVFVGANASGKTSILEGVYALIRSVHVSPELVFRGSLDAAHVVSRHRNAYDSCSLTGHLYSPNLHYDVALEWLERTELSGEDWEEWSRDVWVGADLKSMKPAKPFMLDRWSGSMGDVLLLKLQSSVLAKPSFTEALEPRLGMDGSFLASALLYLSGNQPELFKQLVEQLKVIVPRVERVRFQRARVQEGERVVIADELLLDFVDAKGIPAHACSEGTLLTLGLLTAMYETQGSVAVLIDDIDRGLHPRAQSSFLMLVRKIQELQPNLQIFATTHSPYFVDALAPEEVWCTALHPERGVVCKRLSEHPEFETWIEGLDPGEFWSFAGEGWVLEDAS